MLYFIYGAKNILHRKVVSNPYNKKIARTEIRSGDFYS